MPPRAETVAALLAAPSSDERARPFYEGLRMLGGRTPELALIALRLTLAGRTADDDSVKRLREVLARVRGGGTLGDRAREEYRSILKEHP